MVDIEMLKPLIIERLKELKPDKIILFGSFAYGTPREESDIDLFLIKDSLSLDELDSYELEANRKIRDLVFKYKRGFDILSASTDHINKREDYFHKIDILKNGQIIYEAK